MITFITGATGFIGTHLVRRLAQTEHEPYCLVRRTSHTQELERHGASLVIGDVTDRNSVLEGMKGADWVINLANISSLWMRAKRTYTEINVEGTRTVMECALQLGVSRVLHVSTALVYGKPQDDPFTEDSSPGPTRVSEYARSKYRGDHIAWDLHETKGLPLVIIYPGQVIGPGDNSPSGEQIKRISNGRLGATAFGGAIITYVHVEDVVEVIIRALEKRNNDGEKYLVGKERLSVREFTELVSEVAGVPPPKIHLPDAIATALFMPGILVANIIRKPPMFGLSTDMIRVTRQGMSFDGSKVERDLGVTYTPIRAALEDVITSYEK
jgi:dihydroflavonol-4-reductase